MSKTLLLERMPSTELHTEGFLSFDREILATMERPWIEAETPGGKPYESCVPMGDYQLLPHKRPDGTKAFALTNPELGVYYLKQDVPAEGGRFLILIHIGNWVSDIVGCIAPGLAKGDSPTGRMVKYSSAAMQRLNWYVNSDDDVTLQIRWIV